MPFWTRYPKGTYVRRSPEWYAHQRGRCSLMSGADASGLSQVYGLFNGTGPGVYLHVIGVQIAAGSEGLPLYYGKFYNGVPPTTGMTASAIISPTSAIYSNDPMPYGVGVFGVDGTVTYDDALVVDAAAAPVQFYPTNEIAVIAPGDTLAFYTPFGLGFFNIMFEWYWAID
jgi:hypothetical protein